MKQISFCITCKNRFHQISQTLGVNLEDNKADNERVEFVVVDFGSTDGLRDWILQHFQEELRQGYLNYYFTDQMKTWHASLAKNTAHYYAKGTFLVNLDCDNFTGKNGGAYVHSQFLRYGEKLLIHQFNGSKPDNGAYGRIAMHSRYFRELGGYDECFEPMGNQDSDLLTRLRDFGLIYKRFNDPEYSQAIPNTKAAGIQFCESRLSWGQMDRKNHKTSAYNIHTGRLRANHGIFGYRDRMFKYLNNELTPYSREGLSEQPDQCE